MRNKTLLAFVFAACATQNPKQPEIANTQPESVGTVVTPPTSPTPGPISVASSPIPIGKAPMPKTSLWVFSRPLVRNVLAGDPLGLALHFETEKGPMDRSAFPQIWDLAKTLEGLSFEITAPDKTVYKLNASWKDTLSKRYLYALSSNPTLFLTLTNTGVQEAQGFDGTWPASNLPDLSLPGTYSIKVSGALRFESGDPLLFESAAVEVRVDKAGVGSFASMKKRAREEREKKSPGAKWITRGQRGTDSGFVADVVLEDELGNRLLRAAEAPPGFGYPLHTTTFTAAGDFVSHEVINISTCVAEGTLVETARGSVPIEELFVGEKVVGFDLQTQTKVLVTLRSIEEASSDRFIVLGDLWVTPEHPVFVDGEWKAAGDILEGEKLWASFAGFQEASPITQQGITKRVFDLDVEETHNFFAGGVLVHNKDRDYWSWLDDSWYFMWSPKRPTK